MAFPERFLGNHHNSLWDIGGVVLTMVGPPFRMEAAKAFQLDGKSSGTGTTSRFRLPMPADYPDQ